MFISSMTGFARKNSSYSVGEKNYSWLWEMKSVNGKTLDLKTRLPQWLENLAPELKNKAGEILLRGNVNASLEISLEGGMQEIKVNEALMNKLAAKAIDLFEGSMGKLQKPTATDILLMKGVVEIEEGRPDEQELEELKSAVLASFVETCIGLKKDRQAEGEKIKKMLQDILQKISLEVEKAEKIAADLPEILKKKLQEQIALWLAPSEEISPERLAQEVVLMINRSDVTEELDRLKAHLQTATEMMAKGGEIGRRMDFLCQELNREANTLCSKSADIELTNLGMSLKTLIEQFREQIQNIE